MDSTAREASNTPLTGVEDKILMDEGVAKKMELLCHIRKTPNVLFGIFLELTRQFYSDEDNLPIDVCGAWDKDVTKTGVWIATEYEWEDAAPEFRPAIYIKLSPIQYAGAAGRRDGRTYVDMQQAEYHHARIGTGTVSWVHIGGTAGEAGALAGATLDYMDGINALIQDSFQFDEFAVASISPLTHEKESRDAKRSVVTAAFSFQDTWSVKRESQKLKRIVFNTGQELLNELI